jgi:hypothetical protein
VGSNSFKYISLIIKYAGQIKLVKIVLASVLAVGRWRTHYYPPPTNIQQTSTDPRVSLLLQGPGPNSTLKEAPVLEFDKPSAV